MRQPVRGAAVWVIGVLLIGGLAATAFGEGRETLYDGTFTLKPNGDMAVVTKLSMPMLIYQRLRDSVSNLHLMMRDLASSRADTEVVDRKPEWDDATRTITFSMTVKGASRNMGNHWEIPVVKGALYTTFNEKERTFFFNEAASGPLGDVRGTTKGILPDGATDAKWDASRRVITYVMPAPRTVISGPVMGLFIPGVSVAGLGLVMFFASFFFASKRMANAWQAPRPPYGAPPPPQAR